MERIHALVPTPDLAERIVRELRRMGIGEDNLAVVASEELMTPELPAAGPDETRDALPGAGRGAAAGGAAGLVAGIAAVAVPGAGLAVAGTLAATTLLGAGFGAWVSAMLGASAPHRAIEEYEDALRRGHLLIVADVNDEAVAEAMGILREVESEASVDLRTSSRGIEA